MRPTNRPFQIRAGILPSGLSTLNKYQIAERGARMTRRVHREYREYLREAQRSQPGCPAREVVLDQRGQATSRRPVQFDTEPTTGNRTITVVPCPLPL